jgi:hypothetical protein
MEKALGGGEQSASHEQDNDRRNQRFLFGPFIFNVDRAQEIVTEDLREADDLLVVPWARYYGLDEAPETHASVFAPQHLDREYAMTTDLDDPVLVATLRNSRGKLFSLLIDGTHRLYKAYRQGLRALPAYLLDEGESLSIREDPFVSSPVHWDGYDRSRLVGDTGAPGEGEI